MQARRGLIASASWYDNHYGIVQINWAARDVQLQLKDTQGRIMHAATIPMKDIQA